MVKRVAIGSDHAGFTLKQALIEWLANNAYQVKDVGTESLESVDYPRYAADVARLVASGEVDRGVLVCGSGQGVCMTANKIPGVRAGVVRGSDDAEMIRRHNDASIACFGEQATDPATAVTALAVFLTTDFDGGRHARRVEQMAEIERAEVKR